MAKKIALSLFVIVAFGLYSLGLRHEDTKQTALAPLSTTPATSGGTTGATTSTTQTMMASSATYKDGTYTGSVADAFYGNIQVQATISGGKLTDVQFLQYPNDRRDSLEINQQAIPLLKQEALQAQSAHVDGVSGATDTSQAFVLSLTAALNKAV